MRNGEREVHKVLIRRSAIEKRVKAVARQITREYKGQRVHLIGVLKGACFFLADLAREIDLETSIDFISVASYGKGKDSSGQVRLLKDLDSSIAGLNVILVEDILDTGRTLLLPAAHFAPAQAEVVARGGAARQALPAGGAGEGRLHWLYHSK